MLNKTFTLLLLTFILASASYADSDSCVMPNFDQEVITTASSLKELQQPEITENTCSQYREEFKRRSKDHSKLNDAEFNRLTVLCGKWMFINSGMRTDVGIPISVLNAIEALPSMETKLKNFGFLSDESWSAEPYPFGVVPAQQLRRLAFKRLGANRIVQISCAACHTGKLPDGRVALGASNEALSYGQFNLYTLYSIWLVDRLKLDETRWDADLIRFYQKLDPEQLNEKFKSLRSSSTLPFNQFLLKNIIGEEPPPLETQRAFLRSGAGVYNGFAPSLNFKNRQIFLTTPQLWGIGQKGETTYGSLSRQPTLNHFIAEAFVYSNRSAKYNHEQYIGPIREFLKCLKAPSSPKPIISLVRDTGKKVFERSCIQCHDLTNGGGSITQPAKALTIPSTYRSLFEEYSAPDIQSTVNFDILKKDELLHPQHDEFKVRRLNGIWTRSRLTLNGQVNGLDQMFCLNGKTRKSINLEDPLSDQIHRDLCTNYSLEERQGLREFLEHY